MRNKLTFGKLFIYFVLIVGGSVGLLALRNTENYSNGERIGTITQFSQNGRWFKSYEGHLNVTQTGMNSSTGFDFSIDNDDEPAGIVSRLDSAANNGWKVKLLYHEVRGWNWFGNRGHTNFFVTDVIVLDRSFDDPMGNKNAQTTNNGSVHDTIYMVITPSDKNYQKFFQKPVIKNDTANIVYPQ